jgi:hypothetical protein
VGAVFGLALIVALSGWAAARAGAAAGVLVAMAMLGHNRFYDGFAPANVDHHGLLTASVFGLILGVTFMGAGWWRPSDEKGPPSLLPNSQASARHAAIASALCGAIGVWISAASVLPAIAISGVAALAITLWRGKAGVRAGAHFDPGTWRIWGRVGGITTAVLYLIEYAPAHLGLRLEVNHPLYALAWWGGAEIVAYVGAWSLEGARSQSNTHLARQLLLPVLAVISPLVVIIAGGTAAFMLSDPFIADLRHYVIEGKSLPATARSFGIGVIAYQLASWLVLIPAALGLWRARNDGVLLGFVALVAAVFIAMGFWEVRWWLVGSATQIALLLVLVAGTRHPWRWTLALAGLAFLPSTVQRVVAARAIVRDGVVDHRDVLQPLYRDIAATLRASQPNGDIILLASPNTSMGVGYYGNFQTLGTLFWENAAGLKAAAAIYSARTDAEAAELIRARRVTHIAMISAAPFLHEYFRLLHPASPADDIKQTFGYRLATQRAAVTWLQPIPYRKPRDLELAEASVALFKVAFDQSEMDRLFHTTIALAASGEVATAEATLNDALARTPAADRFPFAESVAAAFYDYDLDAAAVRAFRRALELKSDPGVATTLAWILATTSDASLRDGRAALALVEPIARGESNDPTVLSAWAAALADVGRFSEAVRIAERAVSIARASGDSAASTLLQQRLEAYRANRPWRQ